MCPRTPTCASFITCFPSSLSSIAIRNQGKSVGARSPCNIENMKLSIVLLFYALTCWAIFLFPSNRWAVGTILLHLFHKLRLFWAFLHLYVLKDPLTVNRYNNAFLYPQCQSGYELCKCISNLVGVSSNVLQLDSRQFIQQFNAFLWWGIRSYFFTLNSYKSWLMTSYESS